MMPFTVSHRRILLKQFTLDCQIGIHDFELNAPQRITIDVTLDLQTDLAPQDDDINTVLDYDFLREEIRDLVQSGAFNLQERLCEEIIGLCLARPMVTAAIVRTAKPDVYTDCEAVAYEIKGVLEYVAYQI